MRSKGNGEVDVCASNLMKIVANEYRLNCTAGLPADLIDVPFSVANAKLKRCIEWNINNFEPRANIDSIL